MNATTGEVKQSEENQEPLAATGEEAERLTQPEEIAAKEPQNTEKDQFIEEAISKEIIAKEPEAPTIQEATKLATEDNKEDTTDSRVPTETPPTIPASSQEDLSTEHPPVSIEDKKAEAIVEVVVDESTTNSVEAESIYCKQTGKIEESAVEQKVATEDSVITSPTKNENLEDDVQNVEKDIIDNTNEELISNSSIADPASKSVESIEKSVLIENTSQTTPNKDMVDEKLTSVEASVVEAIIDIKEQEPVDAKIEVATSDDKNEDKEVTLVENEPTHAETAAPVSSIDVPIEKERQVTEAEGKDVDSINVTESAESIRIESSSTIKTESKEDTPKDSETILSNEDKPSEETESIAATETEKPPEEDLTNLAIETVGEKELEPISETMELPVIISNDSKEPEKEEETPSDNIIEESPPISDDVAKPETADVSSAADDTTAEESISTPTASSTEEIVNESAENIGTEEPLEEKSSKDELMSTPPAAQEQIIEVKISETEPETVEDDEGKNIPAQIPTETTDDCKEPVIEETVPNETTDDLVEIKIQEVVTEEVKAEEKEAPSTSTEEIADIPDLGDEGKNILAEIPAETTDDSKEPVVEETVPQETTDDFVEIKIQEAVTEEVKVEEKEAPSTSTEEITDIPKLDVEVSSTVNSETTHSEEPTEDKNEDETSTSNLHVETTEQKQPEPKVTEEVEYGSVGTGSYGITYCYRKVSEWFGN